MTMIFVKYKKFLPKCIPLTIVTLLMQGSKVVKHYSYTANLDMPFTTSDKVH